jgi:NAD(P)-dependent dehydrogenase (short-subunit alcohol dehydrogenase family)
VSGTGTAAVRQPGVLAGQVALVTGAAGGIGAACAELLAEQGAFVVVADIAAEGAARTAERIAADGGAAEATLVDMADVASVRAAVQGAADRHGRLDILVNNAGIAVAKPLLEYTPQDWERQMAVNVTGTFFALQAAARIMVPQGSGRIVNVVSTAGFVSSSTPEAAYDVSKGAVRQLTVSAGAELAPYGVNVNGVAPGTIATPLTDQVLDTPQKRARAGEKIPRRRLGRPDDIAGAVAYLASPAADYVCGHVLVVDGGWLLY